MRSALCAVVLVLLTLLLPRGASSDSGLLPPLHKGIAYVSWWHDLYDSQDSDSSLALLAETGSECISLLVTWYQDTESSTTIYRDPQRTPSDAGVLRVIQRAHDLGMEVLLKPHVDCQNGAWRGTIEFENESDWLAWFSSYTDFVTYYADLAANAGVDELCVGCEFVRTVHRTSDWQSVISEVRALYGGPLTYAANWDNFENVTFWQDLDYAGIDAYFELTDQLDPSLEDLLAAWVPWESQIADFATDQNVDVVFTEIGYRSIDGANIRPWEWGSGGDIDLQEQSDCYEAAFLTFWDRDYFGGYFWWDWWPDPTHGGPDDDGYTPHGKPAEERIVHWYGMSSSLPESPPGRSSDQLRIVAPNPFRHGDRILVLDEQGQGWPYRANIYDSRGRIVNRLSSREHGRVLRWDPFNNRDLDLGSGVYFVIVGAGKTSITASHKIVLVK
jgi:hypothetical protein